MAFVVARTRPDLVRRLILVEPSLQRLLEGDPDGEKLLAAARAVRDIRLAKAPRGRYSPGTRARHVRRVSAPGPSTPSRSGAARS